VRDLSRIGYLVPEFPGQTHNFFWREIAALRETGTRVCLVSTRAPRRELRSASWAEAAERETAYLFPMRLAEAPGIAATLAAAGPGAWLRCASALLRARGTSARERLRMLALLPMAAKLVRLARRQGWRHVHVHSCGDAANVALLARLLAGIDYSLTLHNALGACGGNQRQKWRHASFALVVARELLPGVRAAVGDALPPKIEVVPMGIDPRFFARASPYQPFRGEGEFRIFSCARLHPAKGHAFLLQALALLVRKGVAARLEIAGEDAAGGLGYRRELASLIDASGLVSRVRVLGAVPEERVRERLAACHAFCLPSLHEAFSVATMEAMAMQVPVVATRVGGMGELVSDGSDGLLVPAGDAEALAGALARLARDPELAERLGAAARPKILARFSSAESARVLAALVVEGRSP
jgi:glycosyltransferase involved in cell wall biosynthesis